MRAFVLVVDILPGVRLRLPGELEAKHFHSDAITEAGLLAAKALGGRFSHWEDAP